MAEYIDREPFIKHVLNPYENELDYNGADDFLVNSPSANVVEIPKGATNGDMIKALFPNIEVETRGLITNAKRLDFDESYDQGKPFRTDWWNAPYRKAEK